MHIYLHLFVFVRLLLLILKTVIQFNENKANHHLLFFTSSGTIGMIYIDQVYADFFFSHVWSYLGFEIHNNAFNKHM